MGPLSYAYMVSVVKRRHLKQLILKSAEVVDNHDDQAYSSRLDKVEVKLDEIVHKVGSELENHNKTIQSLPNNTSVVETKLNKWFRSLVQGWIVTVNQLKLCLQMFPTLPLQL